MKWMTGYTRQSETDKIYIPHFFTLRLICSKKVNLCAQCTTVAQKKRKDNREMKTKEKLSLLSLSLKIKLGKGRESVKNNKKINFYLQIFFFFILHQLEMLMIRASFCDFLEVWVPMKKWTWSCSREYSGYFWNKSNPGGIYHLSRRKSSFFKKFLVFVQKLFKKKICKFCVNKYVHVTDNTL